MKEVEDLIEKAKRFLKSAEILFQDEDYDSCASRCYYAMFFMTEAVLFIKGLRASSHKGVIRLFGEHFIKTKVFTDETGKALKRAYDSRQKGDYATGFVVGEKEAKENLERAKNFLIELENYIRLEKSAD